MDPHAPGTLLNPPPSSLLPTPYTQQSRFVSGSTCSSNTKKTLYSDTVREQDTHLAALPPQPHTPDQSPIWIVYADTVREQDMRLVPLPHQLQPRSDAEPLPSFPLTAEAATTIFEFTLERQELLVTCENAQIGQQVRNATIYGACGNVRECRDHVTLSMWGSGLVTHNFIIYIRH
jgi:hypothetical protein